MEPLTRDELDAVLAWLGSRSEAADRDRKAQPNSEYFAGLRDGLAMAATKIKARGALTAD